MRRAGPAPQDGNSSTTHPRKTEPARDPRYAPLSPAGRLRVVHRHLHDGIPQAHVAAQFRVSWPTVATWVARYRAEGEAGLLDRSSRPTRSPAQLAPEVVAEIEALRQERI